MPITSYLPLISVCICLAGVAGVIALGKWPNLRETATLVTGVFNLGTVITMWAKLTGPNAPSALECTISSLAPGMDLAFRVDKFGLIFALVAATLWILKSVYSIGYMRGLHEHAQTRFFACFPIAIGSAMGMAYAGNLVTLFVFYEVLTLSTYPLVFHHEDREAVGGVKRYLSILLGSSVGLQLPALVMLWVATSQNISFGTEPLLVAHAPVVSKAFLTAAFLLFVYGVGKAALMPLHGWLPAAMVAPTPVSSFLHAVAVVKAGVFAVATLVVRVYGVDLCRDLGMDVVLAALAGFTIITASIVALRQDNLKRLLAYSTIGQLSYIVLGVALCSDYAITGGLMHIAAHACGKITLFFCAGAIFVATGKKYISQMVGVGRRMPVTMGAFFVGSLGVIGLPPSGGFLSKWQLLRGSMQSDQIIILIVLLVSSFLNACYFFPIVYRAFFCTDAEAQHGNEVKEAPFACVAPLVVTALLSTALFFYPDIFSDLAGYGSWLAGARPSP